MRLKKFEKVYHRTGRPYFRFYRKTGLFTISKPMIKKIGLMPTDKLSFFQDEDSPKDWYLCIDQDKGTAIRFKRCGTCQMNNALLLKELVDSLNIPYDCDSFIIGSPTELNGNKYYPLLLNKI